MSVLPIQITPCPIIEATVELKFESKLPKGAIFGVLYSALGNRFSKVEKLPTAALPMDIIESDPNLKHKALYRLTDGLFTAQMGFDVVSIHSPTEYVGWGMFSENILSFFEKIKSTGVIDTPKSLALRYLNFFENDIFPHINLQVQLNKEPYQSDNIVLRAQTKEQAFTKILQIANNVTLSNNHQQKNGSLIDIACVLEEFVDLFANLPELLNKAHKLEKELFFGLLKQEFLDTLNPQYNHE